MNIATWVITRTIMHIPKECKVCATKFIAKRENQQFCKRKCFRQDYTRRTREANSVKRFPTYTCPVCTEKYELDFSPAKDQKKWAKFTCTKCKITNDQILKMSKEEDEISSIY
jgi:hypothetical protein